MKRLLITLGTLTLLAMLAAIGLVLANRPVAAAILGTATVFLWLALIVAGMVVVTFWWATSSMQWGADIALRSQKSRDRRDAVLIQSVVKLVKTGMRQATSELPLPPLPGQADDWLPELDESVEGGADRDREAGGAGCTGTDDERGHEAGNPND